MSLDINIYHDEYFEKTSSYQWINIEANGVRIGRARIQTKGKALIINSINIFPKFERMGFARKVVDILKDSYSEIVADRVRNSAVGFWEKMGFQDDRNGNFIWEHDRNE